MLNLNLLGKTALITGATGQLGRTIANTLAQCNANVIIHYNKNKDMALLLQKEISILNISIETFLVSCDITDYKSVLTMKNDINDNFIMPDIIVNTSVIQYEWTTILEQPLPDYDSQYKSSVLHNVHMAKAFVPHMIQNKFGRVIGINTECAMQNNPTQSAYVSGKRGMDGILKVLAKEIGPHNITVNQVAPGWTISDNDRQNHTEKQESYDNEIPLRHRGTDQDIANVVAFLASSLSDYITGAFIPVCGGHCISPI